MLTRRQFTFTAAASAVAAAVPTTLAHAANATQHPITLIVSMPKNGPTDLAARFFADPLSKAIGATVNVENITGDWGMTGAVITSRAKADGRTLILGNLATHAALPVLTNRYDALNDFTPISLLGVSPMVVLVRKDMPLNNLSTLQAYLKANPNRLAIAYGGLGSASAIATHKLKNAFGVTDMRERVYTGTAAALDDLANGEADILIDQMISALPAIRAGKVKAIGITSISRNHAMPGVLTGAQQGFEGLTASNWTALFAPRGMSADLQSQFATAVNTILNDVTVARKMREQGLHVPYTEQRGPDALAHLQTREMKDIANMFLGTV